MQQIPEQTWHSLPRFAITFHVLISVRLRIKLRAIRQEKGLSQERLALDAGMDRTYINSVENGKRNISLCNIVKPAKALGMTSKDFFKYPRFNVQCPLVNRDGSIWNRHCQRRRAWHCNTHLELELRDY